MPGSSRRASCVPPSRHEIRPVVPVAPCFVIDPISWRCGAVLRCRPAHEPRPWNLRSRNSVRRSHTIRRDRLKSSVTHLLAASRAACWSCELTADLRLPQAGLTEYPSGHVENPRRTRCRWVIANRAASPDPNRVPSIARGASDRRGLSKSGGREEKWL
jgi:hypothetical protein